MDDAGVKSSFPIRHLITCKGIQMTTAITVIIPTRNRQPSLRRVLKSLARQTQPVQEVIIVDASDDKSYQLHMLNDFVLLPIRWIDSEASVCIQRNRGIGAAISPWIFLCDDDLEIPADYLEILVTHLEHHPEAGAVSGFVMQLEGDSWTSQYPVTSFISLVWRYVFQLGMWGEIQCSDNHFVVKNLKRHYTKLGNHISKAGWPVITDFSGDYFTTPVYGLGASLVKREWLIRSPYDELLETHGIGDNYGVALGFPGNIQVVTRARVYHHQERTNRYPETKQYYHRSVALHYFLATRKGFSRANRWWFYWSQLGNIIIFAITGKFKMTAAAFRSIWTTVSGNPLIKKWRSTQKLKATRD
jgi:glycosyltransferase involved in cell wall biosynthesis